jgi:hypothetical protein
LISLVREKNVLAPQSGIKKIGQAVHLNRKLLATPDEM